MSEHATKTADEALLTWEAVKERTTTGKTNLIERASVPGGWLVRANADAPSVFVPDQHHTWGKPKKTSDGPSGGMVHPGTRFDDVEIG